MPDREEIIRRLHAEGVTDDQIAHQIGLARNTVTKIRNAMGLPSRHLKPRRCEWETELRRLHAKGMTDRQIADHTGVSRKMVTARRHILGLAVNTEGSTAPNAAPKPVAPSLHMTGLERMIAMAREESLAAQQVWEQGETEPRRLIGAPGEKRGAKRGFDWDAAAQLREQGMSLSDIGARFGVTKASVCSALKVMRASA